jgi:hypothetical protein
VRRAPCDTGPQRPLHGAGHAAAGVAHDAPCATVPGKGPASPGSSPAPESRWIYETGEDRPRAVPYAAPSQPPRSRLKMDTRVRASEVPLRAQEVPRRRWGSESATVTPVVVTVDFDGDGVCTGGPGCGELSTGEYHAQYESRVGAELRLGLDWAGSPAGRDRLRTGALPIAA